MVFNGGCVVAVATLSADLCQYIACNPQRLDTHVVLDLIFCLPLRQLGRISLCICSFFCLHSTAPRYFRYNHIRQSMYSSSSSSSSSDDDESDYSGYQSHSD